MANAEQLITKNLDLWSSAIKAKSSAGRGSRKKVELYGISKLRDLILDLAVRGLLEPQSNEDEAADALLQKVRKIEEQLVTAGELKKPKKSPHISSEEVPFQIPAGWAWKRLAEIGLIGSSSRVEQKDWQNEGVPFYRAREIVTLSKAGKVDNDLFITEEHFSQLSKDSLAPSEGDIMITGVGTIGVPYIVQKSDKFYFKDASVLIFKNFANLYPDYFYLLFKSPYWIREIHKESMGTTVHTLTISRARLVPLPIPPLAEQHRIVAKVDELMALCDLLEKEQENNLRAHETLVTTLLDALTSAAADASQFAEAWQRIQANFDILFTTASSIDQLKQTILQLAVMGKLVPQDPEDESAATLLNKVADERDKLAKKQKRLKAIPADAEPYKIPESWQWCQLGELSISSDSGWSPQCDSSTRENDGQWGVLKVSAVSWGEFRANEHKKLPDGIQPRPECEVRNGDFLLSRANTEDLVARSVVVDQAAPRLMMSDKIVRFILASYISKNYINLANGSIFSREYYKQNSSGTSSSMKNVSRETMAKLPIPLPPLAEQHRIVAKVDELMALCDQLKASLASAQETQLILADSIVEQAIG